MTSLQEFVLKIDFVLIKIIIYELDQNQVNGL